MCERAVILKGHDSKQILLLKFNDSKCYLHVACGHSGDLEAVKCLLFQRNVIQILMSRMTKSGLHYTMHAFLFLHLPRKGKKFKITCHLDNS